jgi:hypothetical protein
VELVRLFPNPAFRRLQSTRLAEEGARQADEISKAKEAAPAEEKRKADEAARKAGERREAEEAARLAEEKRKAAEAARLGEEKRRAEKSVTQFEKRREVAEALPGIEVHPEAEVIPRQGEEESEAPELGKLVAGQHRAERAASISQWRVMSMLVGIPVIFSFYFLFVNKAPTDPTTPVPLPTAGLYPRQDLQPGTRLNNKDAFVSLPGRLDTDAPSNFEDVKSDLCTVAKILVGQRIGWSDIGDCPK